MFRAIPAVFSACLLTFTAFAQITPAGTGTATREDQVILRSGHVTMCQIDKGCSEETVGGRKYLVMKTDGFVLKVASGADQRHGYADISITNETGVAQQVNPANFRMEESVPKLHRLFYVDPNRQQPVVVAREPRPERSDVGKGLPPPEYWTSEEHEQEKKVKAVAPIVSNVPVLRAGSIASGGTVSGRVYFERPSTISGVSVLLALPGALFEFPCRIVVESKSKKHQKKQPVEAQS